jgi:PKD repeat protein
VSPSIRSSGNALPWPRPALAVLAALLCLAHTATAQFGTVVREQKISALSGGFAGPIANDYRFGVSVGELGDFDGDGTRDLLVGSHRADLGGEERGALWILLMNADGTVREHRSISALDGGLLGPLDDHDRFAISAVSLGDLDLDGTTDVAVGAYRDDDGGTDLGCVYVLFLNPDGSVKAEQKISAQAGGFTGTLQNEDSFGWSVENIGDLDDDGVTDLAVGATRDDGGDPDPTKDLGAVYLLFLRPDGTVKNHARIGAETAVIGPVLRPRDRFGADVACLDDADGDGVEDLAVGAFGEDPLKYGKVFILHMNADGSVKSHQEIGNNTGGFTGVLGRSDRFGIALASDDFDGDGLQDLAIGAGGDDDGGAEAGALWICLLEASGRVRSFEKISPDYGGFGGVLHPGDNFAISCATLGDLDRDGAADLAVGAYQDDDGGFDRGAAWVLFRSGTGAPVADFVSAPPSGEAPLVVSFTDRSSGAITAWHWDFGDGTSASEPSPTHSYTQPGAYEVALTVTSPLGMDTLRRQRAVVVLEPIVPTANFTATPVEGVLPLSTAFFDLSTGSITSWSWDFGDGAGASVRYPKHAYEQAGSYTVSLTVTGELGTSNRTIVDLVQVSAPPPLEALFDLVHPGGVAPVAVQFVDRSTGGVTSWHWDFGDGASSVLQSPVHSFEDGGLYLVTLTVARPGETHSLSIPVEIAEPPPDARFSVSTVSGEVPLLVRFTDRSTGNITTWLWDFGDGTSFSTERFPSHVYRQPGQFTVRLRVQSAGGVDGVVRQDMITAIFTPVLKRLGLVAPVLMGGVAGALTIR